MGRDSKMADDQAENVNGKEQCNGTIKNDANEREILETSWDVEEQKEYEDLDKELDRLNSCLDTIEDWNDSLHSRIKDFLSAMQHERQEQEANSVNNLEKMNTGGSK